MIIRVGSYRIPSAKMAIIAVAAGALASTVASAVPARFERFTYRGQAREAVVIGAGQFRNPILPGYYPDPSVTRVDDDYYLVTSSFAHFPGLPVFRSKDLVNWVQIGNAVDRSGQVDLSGRTISEGLFAPDMSYHAGTFFFVNTCVKCGGNFVITATNPAGPWSNDLAGFRRHRSVDLLGRRPSLRRQQRHAERGAAL
jgi:xylan 1,4-beta-xylosidase